MKEDIPLPSVCTTARGGTYNYVRCIFAPRPGEK